ncbi:hypothetical protein [Aeromonas sp. 603079]|uniref:hypothetical protein n=1 Tax=Aeromonas sp. 603079 TaxID=2712045 RepID=UPI003BA08A8E
MSNRKTNNFKAAAFVPFFLCALPSSLFASEIMECTNLDMAALSSESTLSCSTIMDINSEEKSRNSSFNRLSPNSQPTYIRLHNKGGYTSWMKAEYQIRNSDGTISYHYEKTGGTTLGLTSQVKLPADAENVRVQAQLNTLAPWQPIRDIFIKNLTANENVWSGLDRENKKVNIIQFDVWGTTFHSNYALVQPKHTERNDYKLKSWGSPGKPGDLYVYENPYRKNIVEVFKLKGNPGAYYPIDSRSNNDWDYVSLKKWGEPGNQGDLYEYRNTYTRTSDVMQLKNRGNPNAYFPTDGADNKDWRVLGQYHFKY